MSGKSRYGVIRQRHAPPLPFTTFISPHMAINTPCRHNHSTATWRQGVCACVLIFSNGGGGEAMQPKTARGSPRMVYAVTLSHNPVNWGRVHQPSPVYHQTNETIPKVPYTRYLVHLIHTWSESASMLVTPGSSEGSAQSKSHSRPSISGSALTNTKQTQRTSTKQTQNKSVTNTSMTHTAMTHTNKAMPPQPVTKSTIRTRTQIKGDKQADKNKGRVRVSENEMQTRAEHVTPSCSEVEAC